MFLALFFLLSVSVLKNFFFVIFCFVLFARNKRLELWILLLNIAWIWYVNVCMKWWVPYLLLFFFWFIYLFPLQELELLDCSCISNLLLVVSLIHCKLILKQCLELPNSCRKFSQQFHTKKKGNVLQQLLTHSIQVYTLITT